MRKFVLYLGVVMGVLLAYGEITVSDVEVFSGYPWKEVVIGYTITGTDRDAVGVRVTATDKSANKIYTVKSLWSGMLTEGRHTIRWDAAAGGTKFSSEDVVFAVSVWGYGGVQLWANGPYWAECNVGATKPEDYGYYFWWGDTVGYKRNAENNGWVSVKDGSSFSFTSGNCPTYGMPTEALKPKYLVGSGSGYLESRYDAATAHLGSPWRMPTNAEFGELISNCTTTWTTRNGVSGQLVTGKGAYASKSIFLPAAGCGIGSYSYGGGYYWSSTPEAGYSNNTYYLVFGSDDFYRDRGAGRDVGRSVRPVRRFAQ